METPNVFTPPIEGLRPLRLAEASLVYQWHYQRKDLVVSLIRGRVDPFMAMFTMAEMAGAENPDRVVNCPEDIC